MTFLLAIGALYFTKCKHLTGPRHIDFNFRYFNNLGMRLTDSPGMRLTDSPGMRVTDSPGMRVTDSPGMRLTDSPGMRQLTIDNANIYEVYGRMCSDSTPSLVYGLTSMVAAVTIESMGETPPCTGKDLQNWSGPLPPLSTLVGRH